MAPCILNIAFARVRKILAIIVLITFFCTSVQLPAFAQLSSSEPLPLMPAPGTMVSPSLEFSPIVLKGVHVNFNDPFRFEFYVDAGQSKLDKATLNEDIEKQIKYFMAGLAVPENDLWVNLSPYENHRIIAQTFGQTILGKDLLAQDYLLKQLTASLIYPENTLGKKFWNNIYKQAYEKYGTTNVPINTFNKVWIMPQTAVVYEHKDRAFVLKSRLKVLLEKDYLSLRKHMSPDLATVPASSALDINDFSSRIVKEIVIPQIEKEINEGKNFSQLRQIYNALILANWYKKRFQESFLGVNYFNQNKVLGVDVKDKQITAKIYQEYLQAYKKGVYNYINQEYDPYSNEVIPRKYFSGGVVVGAEVERASTFVASVTPQEFQAGLNGPLLSVQEGNVLGAPTRTGGAKEKTTLTATGTFTASGRAPKGNGDKAQLTSVEDLLSLPRLLFTDPRNPSAPHQANFLARMEELDKEFRQILKDAARADIGEDGLPLEDIKAIELNQIKIRLRQAKVIQAWFDIGRLALDKDGTAETNQNRNFLVALIAFKKVSELQPLVKSAYANIVINSEYKPFHEATIDMLTLDAALDKGSQITDRQLRQEYDGYVRTLDEIKDLEVFYTNALQNYIADVSQKYGIGSAAVENIVYDLGISDKLLNRGVTNYQGRLGDDLYNITLALRELLFTQDPRVNDGMRANAAEFLASMFDNNLRFGLPRGELDLNGGLAVSADVPEMNLKSQNLEILKKEEEETFRTFWAKPDGQTVKGHSLVAMSWLANFYRKYSKQYQQRYVGDALALESALKQPELYKLNIELAKKKTLEEMLSFYLENFKPVDWPFLKGKDNTVVISLPVRVEDSAGGIGDPSFLSIFRPHLYRILNHAGLLSRNDGTVGRNVTITIRLVDRKDLPKRKNVTGEVSDEETFLSVTSNDVGFNELVVTAEDCLKKTKADLILRTLAPQFFPKVLMKKAIKETTATENKAKETMVQVFDHNFGKGKGLEITLHVDGISANSGLAVSSELTTGTQFAEEKLLGKKSINPPMRQRVNRLQLKVDEPGFYYVEIARDGQFNDKNKTYPLPARAVDGTLELDLIPEEMPAGAGTYAVRLRRIQDDVEDVKDIKENAWMSPVADEAWLPRGNIVLDDKVSGSDEHVSRSIDANTQVDAFDRVYEMMDDMDSTANAIRSSQKTVLDIGGKAGSQDELSGLGGMNLSYAGDPIEGDIFDENGNLKHVKFAGSVVPKVERVALNQRAIERINRGMRIFRIGMSDPAEDTLDALFTTSLLNASREAQSAWAAITMEMLFAAQRGDVLGLGNAAYQAIALRQKVAPVSINPIVLRVLEDFVHRYGQKYGFRYGITGARSTGSVLIFMNPDLPVEVINGIMSELEIAMKASRDQVGKVGANEANSRAFPNSKIAMRGTATRQLSSEEARWYSERVLKVSAAYEEAKRRDNQKRMALYTPAEYAEIVQKYHLDTPLVKSPAEHDATPVLTIDRDLVDKINELMARHPGGRLTEDDIKELRHFARDINHWKYQRFNSSGVNYQERVLLHERLRKNNELIAQAQLNAFQERLFLAACAEGRVDMFWDFKSSAEIKAIVDALAGGREFESAPYRVEHEQFKMSLKQVQDDFDDQCGAGACDGISHFSPQFNSELADEIVAKNRRIAELNHLLKMQNASTVADMGRNEQERQELRNLELIVKVISTKPSPELFEFAHFIFSQSTTYQKYFGRELQVLQQAAEDGAYVDYPLYGGTGARAFGGRVKGVFNFQAGEESEMTFLKGSIRNWAAFIKRFPSKRKAFINILVSAFTENAVKAVLADYIKEAGLDMRNTKVTAQSVREVVRPTELELMLNLALQSTSTEAEYNELRRIYDWYIRVSKEELAKQHLTDPTAVRAPYVDAGLNPLNSYNPAGNIGPVEAMMGQNAYTLQDLINANYPIILERLALLKSSSDGERQLNEGMPLAVAQWLIDGPGLKIANIRNGTSTVKVGPDVNIGRATNLIIGFDYDVQQFRKENKDPASLISALNEVSGSKMPITNSSDDIFTLNNRLDDLELYKSMNVRPAECQRLINKLEAGENLSLWDRRKLNRLLIEANFPNASPKKPDVLAVPFYTQAALGDDAGGVVVQKIDRTVKRSSLEGLLPETIFNPENPESIWDKDANNPTTKVVLKEKYTKDLIPKLLTNDLTLDQGVDEILKNLPADAIARLLPADLEKVKEVLKMCLKGRSGAITTLEANRMQFVEEVIFEDDHTSIATGTVLFNTSLAWKLLGYAKEIDYVLSPIKERNERIAHYMNVVWPRAYNIRMRKEDKPGESNQWPAEQSEVILQWVLEWAQEQENLGLDSVKYQEVMSENGLVDPKTTGQLRVATGRNTPNMNVPIMTKLPPGLVEEGKVAIADRLVYAGSYLEQKLFGQAARELALAKRTLAKAGDLEPAQRAELLQRIQTVERVFESRLALQRESNVSVTDINTIQNAILGYMHKMDDPRFNIYAAVGLEPTINLDPLMVKHEMGIMTNDCIRFVKELEGSLKDKLGPLMKAIKEVVGRQYPGLSNELLLEIACRMILRNDVEGTLKHFDLIQEPLTNLQARQIKKAMPLGKTESPDSPMSLAFLRAELMAIYDALNDVQLFSNNRIQGLRASEYRFDLWTDKDATVEDPALALKQSPNIVNNNSSMLPDRAWQLIQYAKRGARVDILTGSTAQEGWEQVLEPLSRVLTDLPWSMAMKKIVMQRLCVLTNDGSVIMQLTMDGNGRITHGPLEYNKRFRNGAWYKAQTLLKTNGGGREDKSNRLVYWESVIKSFLTQFFHSNNAWDKLTGSMPGVTYQNDVKSFDGFINQLKLSPEDIDDFLGDNVKNSFLDIQEHMSIFLLRMLEHYDQEGGHSEDSNRWRDRFYEIIHASSAAEKKLTKPEALEYRGLAADEIERREKVRKEAKLTSDELLIATINRILIKESAGTYGSVTGDHLEHARDADKRLGAISEVVLNKVFWDNVERSVIDYFVQAKGKGAFVDDAGNLIPISTRSGPGYLNIVFGGVSKKNYLTGSLQDWRTRGRIVVITGDSLKDQGEFPYILDASITQNLGGALKELKANLTQHAHKSLADRISTLFDETKGAGAVSFEGAMTKEDHDLLIGGAESNAVLIEAINALYKQSASIHLDRVLMRFLLGLPFEDDRDKLAKKMTQGLYLTNFTFTTANLYNPLNQLERWGPAAFYPIISAILDGVGEDRIIPRGDPSDILKASDAVLRLTIAALNRNLTPGVSIPVPLHMKKMAPVSDEEMATKIPQKRDHSAFIREEGGIDFRSFDVDVKSDDKGVPLPFIWKGRKIRLGSLRPVIYSIKIIDNPNEYLAILGLALQS